MSPSRPPGRVARTRARAHVHPRPHGPRLRRLAAVALTCLGATLAAAASADAWNVEIPAVAWPAHAASGLPAMGVPLSELLQAAPQLAPGSSVASSSSIGHGASVEGEQADAGSIVQVRPDATIDVYRSPGGQPIEALDSRSDSGAQARAFTVYAVSGSGWLGVSVPILGGHIGWIAANPADVFVRAAVEEIRVSLAARRLELIENGRAVLSTLVVIGAADSPTPPGQFDVDDILHYEPASPEYGIGALALSVPPPGRSWEQWRVAIHGLNNLGTLGGTGSLGCVHVPTTDLRRLLAVPVGTPVDIVRS